MSDRTSSFDEAAQREFEFKTFYQIERLKSYDLTQRLAFFVIGLEAVFCGYILLNARTLTNIHGLEWLFLLYSVALFLGIVWRFAYNEKYHRWAHLETNLKWFKIFSAVQKVLYVVFVLFSLVSLIAAIVMGFIYLQSSRVPLRFV